MPVHPIDVHVGGRLKLRRKILGLSQDALASQIGVTFQQVQKYERGINRIGAGRLHDLAEILRVTVSYFYDGYDSNEQAAGGFAEGNGNFENEVVYDKQAVKLSQMLRKIRDPKTRELAFQNAQNQLKVFIEMQDRSADA